MFGENRTKYLVKNTTIFALGSLANKLITFFLVPLYTYVLSAEEYGTVDLIATISMVAAPVLMLNIGESVLRFSLDPNIDKNKVMSAGLLCLMGAGLLGTVLFLCVKQINGDKNTVMFLYWYILSAAASQLLMCYLRGKEQLTAYAIGSILNTAGIAILNLIFLLYFRWGVSGYLTAYILANFITAIYAAFVGNIRDVIRNFCFDKNLFLRMVKYSVILIPNVFLWWIMNSADRIVVSAFLGVAANGIFAIAYKIPSLLATLSSIFNQAWSYSAIREDESEDKAEYTNMVYTSMFSIVLFLAAGMLLVIKPFLWVYVSPEYYSAWKYVPMLVVGFVFQAMATFLSTPYTVNFDSKGFLFSAAAGAAINIILNVVLVIPLGINGVAFATMASYITVFLYRAWDTRKYVRIKLLCLRNTVILITVVLMCFSLYLDGAACYLALTAGFLIILALEVKILKPMLCVIIRKFKK